MFSGLRLQVLQIVLGARQANQFLILEDGLGGRGIRVYRRAT
jgi:hypothetical protein